MSEYLLGVRLHQTTLLYYVSSTSLASETKVIVEDPSVGLSLGNVESCSSIDSSKTESFPKILRVATKEDERLAQIVQKQEADIAKYVIETVNKRNLEMKVLKTILSLDTSKLLIIYSAEERVDFREIVKEFAKAFHTHIEMRQIGSRDRAQIIGGIGVCGLKLCCSTFIKNFDVISINMAKNQLLSLNIPKLSGQCGKLICCLKYEDDNYAELRKRAPKIGEKYIIDKKEYRITGLNLLTDVVTLFDGEEYINLDKKELRKYQIKHER